MELDGKESQVLLYNHNLIYAYWHDELFRLQFNRLVLILTQLLRYASTTALRMNQTRVFGEPEIMKDILGYLDAHSLAAASRASVHWNHIYIENSERLWTDLCIADFNLKPNSILKVTTMKKTTGEPTKKCDGNEKLTAKNLYKCTFERMTEITRPKLTGVRGLGVTTVDRSIFRL